MIKSMTACTGLGLTLLGLVALCVYLQHFWCERHAVLECRPRPCGCGRYRLRCRGCRRSPPRRQRLTDWSGPIDLPLQECRWADVCAGQGGSEPSMSVPGPLSRRKPRPLATEVQRL